MRKIEQKDSKHLFPIKYNGKLWDEKDCDDVFLAFYDSASSLYGNCAVYMADGYYITPDGDMQSDEDDD